MDGWFEGFFKSDQPARDKFLSRLFGLFSERVVSAWCACSEAAYEDLGRPTLYLPGETGGRTIDFTLRRRVGGQTYAAELKCELEFEGYRYLRLSDVDQLHHHAGEAFVRFLALARDPEAIHVRVGGKPVPVNGAILIWGATAPEGCVAVTAACGFSDVLSVENMLSDLARWRPEDWNSLVDRHRGWTTELFDMLASSPNGEIRDDADNP